MLTLLLIVAILFALVIAHEWGHLIVAKRRGVTAEEFGIGFPPRLAGRIWRGTLYSLNLIPLGGFVRLKGEDGGDQSAGSFGAAALGTKVRILLAGVGMNVIVAIILLVALCWAGLPDIGGFEPGFISGHYTQSPRLMVVEVVPGSPAAKLGLHDGDYLVQANGRGLVTDAQLQAFTKAQAGRTVALTIVAQGHTLKRSVRLRSSSAGSAFLGVATQPVSRLRYGWWEGIVAAIWITGKLFLATIWAVLLLIIQIPALIAGLFSHQVPAAAANVSGPVGIYEILKNLTGLGPAYVLLFMANISVALAAFNVLPIPALDGGRLALILAQASGRRRLRPSTEATIHAIGYAALIVLMVVITVYDVRKFF